MRSQFQKLKPDLVHVQNFFPLSQIRLYLHNHF
jgi:hypothetical protein